MDIEEYQIEIERTCPHLESEFGDQLHMAIGISTESGELLDAYKKRYAYSKPLDMINVAEEIGDIFWYAINLCRMLNLSLGDVLEKNVNKLKIRYPEKFTEENAISRDLEKERKILEG